MSPSVACVTRELIGLAKTPRLLAWTADGYVIMGIAVTAKDPIAWARQRPTAADQRRAQKAVDKELANSPAWA